MDHYFFFCLLFATFQLRYPLYNFFLATNRPNNLKHKNHLDSLCKVVDPNIKHQLTFSSHRSGHTNMSTGRIVIDGDLLEENDDNLDITAGLAIHEKLHLVYSQELMTAEAGMRDRLTTTHGQSMLLHDICNIIEDEYI